MPSLAEALASRASTYAHRAVDAYVAEHLGDFVLFGGVAIEAAMKARLARENPAFVAASNNFKSAVSLHRASDDADQVADEVRTVGGRDAFERVKVLEPSFGTYQRPIEQLLGLRNDEAHLGVVALADAETAFISFLRVINALLRIDQDRFWDPHSDLVRTSLDESAEEVRRAVQMRLARARANYKARVAALDEPTQMNVIADHIRDELRREDSDDTATLECPACHETALVYGENTVEHDAPQYGSDGDAVWGDTWIEFVALALRCGWCGLELDGHDEIQAAELDPTWVNDDIDYDRFMRDYFDAW